MNSKHFVIPTLLAALLIAPSCRPKQEVTASFSTFKFDTTCLGAAHDGTQTLRAWGTGPEVSRAVEQAKKNALYDVLFLGIPGERGCRQTALVTEVNARERYSQYFDRFFSNGGEYTKFVRESSERDGSRITSKSNSRINYGIIVDVDVVGLKRQLEEDGIIRR